MKVIWMMKSMCDSCVIVILIPDRNIFKLKCIRSRRRLRLCVECENWQQSKINIFLNVYFQPIPNENYSSVSPKYQCNS